MNFSRLRTFAIASIAAVNICFAAPTEAASPAITPIRPPAVPLIVRQPYVSTWQPSNTLNGAWPVFWTGQNKDMSGIVRIDGKSFAFMGVPAAAGGRSIPALTQTSLTVTPTQSIYVFSGDGISMNVEFLSPVEPTDLRRQSIPMGYIMVSASSVDGTRHKVQLYCDVSGEWTSGDISAKIGWQKSVVADPHGSIEAFSATPTTPGLLQEKNDSALWGTAVWAVRAAPGVSTKTGFADDVRSAFMKTGVLDDTDDGDQPRAIQDKWPVFAYAADLGPVGTSGSRTITFAVGNLRNPAVSYLGSYLSPLWSSYWPDWKSMTAFFLDDRQAAQVRADELDKKILADARLAGGAKYAAICTLALRQAFGATELVGSRQKPWMFMKEISSDGNISTVDVVYPSFPVFLYVNPELLKLQLDPLLAYAESGKWPQPFAEHDIGSSYPIADAHNDGGGENMPVEESANMLIMAAAYMRYAPLTEAQMFAKQHYHILKQWADYLLSVPPGGTAPNALDPQFQNQTDDFTGPIAHSVNLSLKGIIGVGAMSEIAGYAGNIKDRSKYIVAAQSMIGHWSLLSQSPAGSHLMMQYIEPDTPEPTKWTDGIVGTHSFSFYGSGDFETSTPVVDTSKSFTVTAWVMPYTVDGYQTYVSIDGTQVSGFYLQLISGGHFAISIFPQDTADGTDPARAVAQSAAVPGTWYQLAGVYDADHHTLSLYVNGVLQQTVSGVSSFKATGATAIGRGFYDGENSDPVHAALDDVRLYQSALTPTALSEVDAGASNPAGYWPLDIGTGIYARDLSGNGYNMELTGVAPAPETAWSLKYNAFPDKLLGLYLIPESILTEEASFYKTKITKFGIPLDIRHDYTKTDWELWTAASTDDLQLRQSLIDGAYNFANISSARVPFGDWYDTKTGQQIAFQARPVIGGVFSILDRVSLVPNE